MWPSANREEKCVKCRAFGKNCIGFILGRMKIKLRGTESIGYIALEPFTLKE